MIRAGFLPAEDRFDMIALARDGAAAHRLARRANALVLLDDGWSCVKVAKALYVDDDPIFCSLAAPGTGFTPKTALTAWGGLRRAAA